MQKAERLTIQFSGTAFANCFKVKKKEFVIEI